MVKIQYEYLTGVGKFLLDDLSSKGKKSRHRMRIVNAINEQSKKVAEEEIILIKEYAELDDKGEFIKQENGNIKITGDKKELKEQQEELNNEYFIIDDANLETALKTVKKLVFDYDKELHGEKAFIHDYICQQFEAEEEEAKEDKKEEETE